MQSLFRKYTETVYFILLLLCCSAVMWGNFCITVVTIALFVFWLCSGNFAQGFSTLSHRKTSLLFAVICLAILLRLAMQIPDEDALHGLIKYLPLFVFILTIGCQSELQKEQFHRIMMVFVLSLFINTIVCFVHFIVTHTDTENFRNISWFMSYLRLSLFVLLGITICSQYLFYQKDIQLKRYERIVLAIALLWFVLFLVLLKSFTAYVIFAFLFLYFILYQIHKTNKKRIAILGYSIIVVGILSVFLGIYSEARFFLHPDKVEMENLEKSTPYGNAYTHEKGCQVENGHWVYLYVCRQELENSWSARTGRSVWEQNDVGHITYYTLIRYMASKGLRKDAADFQKLSDADIDAVKQGFTNYRFLSNSNPRKRLYEICWEWFNYLHDGNPNGHSITQRIEFLKCAFATWTDNFWFGTGGKIQSQMFAHYQVADKQLTNDHWCLPHNQWMFFAVSGGIVGLILFAVCFIGMFFFSRQKWNTITVGWFIIATISFFTEDTINSEAGQAFFGLMGAIVLFAQPQQETILQ